jgi:hypothetical protein
MPTWVLRGIPFGRSEIVSMLRRVSGPRNKGTPRARAYWRTLDAIDTSSDNYDLFTVGGAIVALSATAELVFTFANKAAVTARQARFMYVQTASEWR